MSQEIFFLNFINGKSKHYFLLNLPEQYSLRIFFRLESQIESKIFRNGTSKSLMKRKQKIRSWSYLPSIWSSPSNFDKGRGRWFEVPFFSYWQCIDSVWKKMTIGQYPMFWISTPSLSIIFHLAHSDICRHAFQSAIAKYDPQ